MIREREIEAYFVEQCKLRGWLPLKFVSPGYTGVPDRIVIGWGWIAFVELKAPGEKPTPRQIRVHQKLMRHDVPVFILDSREAVDQWVRGKK